MKGESNIRVSNSLKEVWEWKEKVYQDTDKMDFKSLKAYYQRCMGEATKKLGRQLTVTCTGRNLNYPSTLTALILPEGM